MTGRRHKPTSDRIPVGVPHWYGWRTIAMLRELAGCPALCAPPFA